MDIPTDLKHKPVIVAEGYDRIDGRNAYDSDVKGLSLGLAQWSGQGRPDISVKVWRRTGEEGPANRRNSLSTGCWTWRSSPAVPFVTFGMRGIAIPRDTTKRTRPLTVLACRATP